MRHSLPSKQAEPITSPRTKRALIAYRQSNHQTKLNLATIDVKNQIRSRPISKVNSRNNSRPISQLQSRSLDAGYSNNEPNSNRTPNRNPPKFPPPAIAPHMTKRYRRFY